jgi:hypothetical protein
MLPAAPQSSRPSPSLGMTPSRSVGGNGLSAAPEAGWRDLCCARRAAIEIVARSSEVVLAAEAPAPSAFVVTPLLLEQAS